MSDILWGRIEEHARIADAAGIPTHNEHGHAYLLEYRLQMMADRLKAATEQAACMSSALNALRHERQGGCWCNATRGSHSSACKAVRMLMRKSEEAGADRRKV